MYVARNITQEECGNGWENGRCVCGCDKSQHAGVYLNTATGEVKLAPSLAQLQQQVIHEQHAQAQVLATPQPAVPATSVPRTVPASSSTSLGGGSTNVPAFSPFGQTPASSEQRSIFSSAKKGPVQGSSSTMTNMASAQSQVKTTSKMVLFINPNNTTKISQLLTQINWFNLTIPGGGGFDNFSWAPNPSMKITQTIKSLGFEEEWPKVKDDEGVSHFSYGISYRKGANKWAGGVETMYHPASSSGEGSAMCTFSPPTAASFAQLAMPVCVIIEPLRVTADEDEAEASADAKPTFTKAKALMGKERYFCTALLKGISTVLDRLLFDARMNTGRRVAPSMQP